MGTVPSVPIAAALDRMGDPGFPRLHRVQCDGRVRDGFRPLVWRGSVRAADRCVGRAMQAPCLIHTLQKIEGFGRARLLPRREAAENLMPQRLDRSLALPAPAPPTLLRSNRWLTYSSRRRPYNSTG